MKNKEYTVSEYSRETKADVLTKIVATSQQKAANAYFGVERAIKPMSFDKGASWSNHRHSKNNPCRTIQIVSVETL